MVIQRSWKIPTDVGGSLNSNTTSANEVQQRSSPGMQLQAANSSSDDSDCSNQTTHSMDTRVASPVEGVRKQAEKDAAAESNTITLSLLGESTSSDAESSQVTMSLLIRLTEKLTFNYTSEICNHTRHGGEHVATHSPKTWWFT